MGDGKQSLSKEVMGLITSLRVDRKIKECDDSASKTLIKRLERYEALIKFGQVIASSMDYRNIEKQSVKIIRELLSAEHVLIYRYDEKTNELFSRGLDHSKVGLHEIRLPIDDKTFAGSSAHYRAILHIKTPSDDLRIKREPEILEDLEYKNILLAPLVSKGEILGVIEVVNSTEENFSDEEIHFLEAVSNQLMVALHNVALFERLHNQFLQICEAMGDAISKRDRYTGGHTRRVALFSAMIGEELGLSFADMNELRLSAVLHDFGKIGIEDSILKKTSQLSEAEFAVMRDHPKFGHEILGHIKSLSNVVDGVRYHHERYDGKGYPYGLQGEAIPLIAQIIAVADTFDAMISTRPYRKGLPPMVAHQEILSNAGSQFSNKIVEAFDRAFKKTHMYKTETLDFNKKAA